MFHYALQEINKGLRAPILSVKTLAISVKFANKKDMEKAINLLELFPFLETLHVQVISETWAGVLLYLFWNRLILLN